MIACGIATDASPNHMYNPLYAGKCSFKDMHPAHITTDTTLGNTKTPVNTYGSCSHEYCWTIRDPTQGFQCTNNLELH